MNRPMVASILALALCACEQNTPEITPESTSDRFVSMTVDSTPVPPEEEEDNKVLAMAQAPPEVVSQETPVVGIFVPEPTLDGESGEKAIGSTGLGIRGIGDGGGGLGKGAVGNIGYGRGSGGIVGKHGGGEGFGRIGGLGRVSTGGGKAAYGRGAMGSSARYNGPTEVLSTESYTNYGSHKFTDPSQDKFSTFSIDVDTGSYTIARRKLNDGGMPPRDSVRVEEFINYFKYSYAAPSTGPFAVRLEAAPSPFSEKPNMFVLRVGVQAEKLTQSTRKPIHLTFLVDVSGSMRSRDKLDLAQQSMSYLVDNLREQDTVAIATYAGRVSQVLRPTHASDRETILAAIQGLHAGGGTGMSDGLEAAYQLASESLHDGHISRVIVLSDGDANIGATGHDEILRRIKGYVAKGVTLSTIGFGMGNYKDTMMEQLANKGDGNYYYIDDLKEAQRVFGEQLNGTLQVVAKDVKIQVEFDPNEVVAYRLIGYENRDIADKDFRNDKVDAGEIGAGHSVTALYEVELATAEPTSFATVRVRHKLPTEDIAQEATFRTVPATFRTTVGAASGDFQFAVAVAGFAEILRQSEYAKKLSYDLILEVAKPHVGKDARRKEFVALVKKARGFEKRTN